MKFLVVIVALATTVYCTEQHTTTEIPEPPGFFSAAFSYFEAGLKRIFGFKGDDEHGNSTSVATESKLIQVLSKSTDRAQQILAGGSTTAVNGTTVIPVAIIVVKEDATTLKKP